MSETETGKIFPPEDDSPSSKKSVCAAANCEYCRPGVDFGEHVQRKTHKMIYIVLGVISALMLVFTILGGGGFYVYYQLLKEYKTESLGMIERQIKLGIEEVGQSYKTQSEQALAELKKDSRKEFQKLTAQSAEAVQQFEQRIEKALERVTEKEDEIAIQAEILERYFNSFYQEDNASAAAPDENKLSELLAREQELRAISANRTEDQRQRVNLLDMILDGWRALQETEPQRFPNINKTLALRHHQRARAYAALGEYPEALEDDAAATNLDTTRMPYRRQQIQHLLNAARSSLGTQKRTYLQNAEQLAYQMFFDYRSFDAGLLRIEVLRLLGDQNKLENWRKALEKELELSPSQQLLLEKTFSEPLN